MVKTSGVTAASGWFAWRPSGGVPPLPLNSDGAGESSKRLETLGENTGLRNWETSRLYPQLFLWCKSDGLFFQNLTHQLFFSYWNTNTGAI